jgi:hypothetical protein
MGSVSRHYQRVSAELRPTPRARTLPSRVHAVVLVSHLHEPALRAISYARATRPSTLTALTVQVDKGETEALQAAWAQADLPVSLTMLHSPYRDITGPIIGYVSRIRRESPNDLIAVFVPEYVVGHWWESLLHNQSALRLKLRLRLLGNVMVTSVPYQLTGASQEIAAEEAAQAHVEGGSSGPALAARSRARAPQPAQPVPRGAAWPPSPSSAVARRAP